MICRSSDEFTLSWQIQRPMFLLAYGRRFGPHWCPSGDSLDHTHPISRLCLKKKQQQQPNKQTKTPDLRLLGQRVSFMRKVTQT